MKSHVCSTYNKSRKYKIEYIIVYNFENLYFDVQRETAGSYWVDMVDHI